MAAHDIGEYTSTQQVRGYIAAVTADPYDVRWLSNDSNVSLLYATGEPRYSGYSVLDWCGYIVLGVVLGGLSLLTIVGNALVLHAVRTERRLQSVSSHLLICLARTHKYSRIRHTFIRTHI